MITSGQIKAARALLGISIADFAKLAGIGFTTLVRLESSDGVPSGNIRTFEAVQKAFEAAGVEFIGTPEKGAGVRWKFDE